MAKIPVSSSKERSGPGIPTLHRVGPASRPGAISGEGMLTKASNKGTVNGNTPWRGSRIPSINDRLRPNPNP